MKVMCGVLGWFAAAIFISRAVEPPAPLPPVPSARQLEWHRLEVYGFVHFTINTFTDKEWGYGDEHPSQFAPTDFDADDIVTALRDGGLKGLILTCKHHDGFCLWPSRYTEHSVRHSPWRNGQGDVVREICEACRRHGLKFGVYLSPWDRNHPEYGRPAYVTYFRQQLRELLTQYGPIFEVWFDGANGGEGYYGGARERRTIDRRTYYGWDETWQLVRDLQPDAVIFSDAGPDVRWVGNERGIAGDPCWATLNREDFCPGEADRRRLQHGDRPGRHWVPAECDVSIRPGWFYHSAEDTRVRPATNLVELYFQSVGRGASLLLNVPPDRRGRIHPTDRAVLREFRQLLDEIFATNLAATAQCTASNVRGNCAEFGTARLADGDRATYWAADDIVRAAEVELRWSTPVEWGVLDLREPIQLGQRCDRWVVEVEQSGEWRTVAQGQSIGSRHLWRAPKPVRCSAVRIRIASDVVCPALSEVGVYPWPKYLRTGPP